MIKKTLLIGITALLLATGTAHADEPRYPSDGRSPPPTYTPSWERTQRNYLPSYQRELERRRICGSYCDDLTRRRPKR